MSKNGFYKLASSVVILLAYSAPIASADSTVVRQGSRGAGLRLRASAEGNQAKTIRGHCELVVSGTNPIATSCSLTQLILTDEKGVEVARTRTDSKGQFSFAVEPGQKYRFKAASARYELLAPQKTIRSGQRVQVKLKQN